MEIKTITDDRIEELSVIAKTIWHECYKDLLSFDQIEYMTNLFLSPSSIRKNIREGYEYRVVLENNEIVGFSASKKEDKRIFLSKLYLVKDVRGKGLARILIEDTLKIYDLNKIYLTVNKYNKAYDVYKHLGFRVIDSVVSDIGQGYVMDDYIMEANF